MNKSLFLSWHAAAAGTIVLVAGAVLLAANQEPGRSPGANRTLLLASGWAAAGLFLVVAAYVARKYMHRLGYSPEYRLRVDVKKLERTEHRLNELRLEVLRGSIVEPSEVRRQAGWILKEQGVARVVRAVIVPGPPEGPAVLIRTVRTEPLGRMAQWLHAHAYYGLAAALLVWLHGGAEWSSPMGICLNALSALVVFTGLVGTYLWARGPAWITRAEKRQGITIEMAHALNESLQKKVAAVLEEVDPQTRAVLRDVRRAGADLPERSALALASLSRGADPESNGKLQDALALIGQSSRVARELRSLRRVRGLVMTWRLVHVPLAVLLVGAVVVHVFAVWKY